jgi:hypothetical protein
MTRNKMPILKGVKRRPENRAGRATLFAHLNAVLGGVWGRGAVKASSLNRGLCSILLRWMKVERTGVKKK